MSYCLNPDCQTATNNPAGTKFCQGCGSKVLLKDRYRAIKLIGQGGFGRTFLAVDEDKPSKPRCVIKQFFPQAQGTNNAQKAADLFDQEAVRLDELGKYPQIPELLAYFTQDQRQYLVQEFIDGQNLAQALEAEGAFRETQIRDLLNSLLPVLEFIHSHNVIHRDIKPENIIRRSDGQLVLVDFGAAKFATGSALLKTGTSIGSPEYLAPEQARGKAVFASDLYSLGVTCIYLLTQVSPFDLFDIGEDAWVWRHYLVDNPVSEQLGRILDKLIENATNRRYQSAAEVLKALNPQPTTAAPQPPPPVPYQYNKQSFSTDTSTSKAHNSPPAPQPQTQNWRCVHTLTGHSCLVRSVAFSCDGKTLASGSRDNTIKLWQTSNGKLIHTLGGWFSGHSNWVLSVAFSPDGQTLASGSGDMTINLWQTSNGKLIRTLTGHSNWVYSVAFSRDGQTLASGSGDNTIKIWRCD